MYKLIFLILFSIPAWLTNWIGKSHEEFMDTYPYAIQDVIYHAEYGYVVDTLSLGDTLRSYLINPIVVDGLVICIDDQSYLLTVDSVGNIKSVSKRHLK